ncbi:MAG: FtsX-like permease family protein [Candidatus Saccharibacteria bacterium]|nr:FtsX-like permease family protein [Candidatus Saccharibacteria bacterium]
MLGFSDRKIANIFIQQNVWITIMAIIIGLPLGYVVTDFIFKVAIDESYDFAVFATLHTCLISAIETFLTSIVVSLWLTRRVAKIDMVKSLKGNE